MTFKYRPFQASPGRGAIGRARVGVAEPPSLVEALRDAGVDSFAGEPADDLPALEIGERIREARQAVGLTQAQLAKIAGCKQGDLSDIERGKGRDGPSYRTLKSIATALGVELTVNPQPTVSGIVMIGDEAQVNFAETAYDQLYPLYTESEWAHVGGRVKTRLKKIWTTMNAAGGLADATMCQIIHVGPSQQVRFRCDRGFSVIGRVRGGGAVRVRKPVYRFQASEPGDAVAILSGDSQLMVKTATGESCVFMAVPAHLLLGHGG